MFTKSAILIYFLSGQLHRPHGPQMYTHSMGMDPRFAYPGHIPRHGDPSLNRLPHNFSMQVQSLVNLCFGVNCLNGHGNWEAGLSRLVQRKKYILYY